MRPRLIAIVVALASVVLLALPAGAAVSYSGSAMRQYVANHWPLVALDDETSQNPNWYHVRDSAFTAWGDPIGTKSGPYDQFVVISDCGPWVNRVCVHVAERNLSVSGSFDGCAWTGTPALIGETCRYTKTQGSNITDKVVIVMASNQHGQSTAIRPAATEHEVGHTYGLNHVGDPAYLMYPLVDGNPPSPRGQESGCVFEVYNAPPCVSTNSPQVRQSGPVLPLIGTTVMGEPVSSG